MGKFVQPMIDTNEYLEKIATDPDYWCKIYKAQYDFNLLFKLEIDEVKKVQNGTIGLDQYLYSSGDLHRSYHNKVKEFYDPWMDFQQIAHLHSRVNGSYYYGTPNLISAVFES
mmetsp:Transcript_43280/g.90636  ORF Transcript_43280/g.90636 Transcript_43280/m.90636 type:complete len:113 (+) Transcript_43280:2471-2809(+)